MIQEYGFEVLDYSRDRTFDRYGKLDDAANGTHDYLKYLKFGYGRATDDASTEIRHGRMTREEGIEMVRKHDHVRPQDLDFFMDFLDITEQEFEKCIDHLRDPEIWEKDSSDCWNIKDSVMNHINDDGVDKVRAPQGERTQFLSKARKPEKSYFNDFTII